jgi:hypothetical protein
MLAAAKVPDSAAPVSSSSEEAWQQRMRALFKVNPDASVRRVRYAPPAAQRIPRHVIAGLLGRATFDPLGYLALSAREVERLAISYAPTLEIETRADYDRFGWLRWRRGIPIPQVEAAEPTMYVQAAYTRYGEHLLLQLVYTLWFPERPARDTFEPGSGPLDAVVWRVTLAPDGEPILYDSIHACGCFHAFFPTPRARARTGVFVPQALAHAAEDERPVLTLASATHDIEGVRLSRDAESLVRYTVRPYDELRSMPRLTGGHASAFGADGTMAGSKARQWGRQTIGRYHFDDGDLLERRFELEL